ncbi:MAG: phenylacetate--CoA ligase family protein [candidate division WS1 bacterium]|nr:phenylacetate--CoA ligase family protein [candidate division WS1 bacterium]
MFMGRLRGSGYLAYHLRGQARYPFRPLATVMRDQSRRVRAMVAYAYRYVPYYRETLDRLSLRPCDFQSADDLAQLPLLRTAEYCRDPERFLSTEKPRGTYLALPTSGSTGLARIIYHDARGCLQNIAHAERDRMAVARFLGDPLRYRESVLTRDGLTSTPHKVQEFCRQHAWFPPYLGIQRQYLSMFDSLEHNVGELNRFQPDVIHSIGSYLAELFGYLKRTGVPCHLPRVVTYGSEGVSEAVRRLILEDFGLPLISAYQATEAFKLGFECEQHSGLHLNLDLYPLRVVDTDGKTLPRGETGEVVVSNLVNRGTVLLNYHLGDLAALLPDPCPCGRTLPLLSFLRGRARDFLRFGEGRIVNPWALDRLICEGQEVWQYQLVQETPTRLRLALVVPPTCDLEQTRKRLAAGLAALCGPEVTLELALVERIQRTAGGKVPPLLAWRPDAEEELFRAPARLSD